MDQIVAPLVIVAVLVCLLVLVAGAFILRRQTLARRRASFDCSLRHADGHWSLGVARYRSESIEWFRIFSFSLRPMRVWRRDDLAIAERRATDSAEVTSLLPHAVVVRCRHRGEDLDLAMSSDAYTGFASWIESAPPGRHAHVT